MTFSKIALTLIVIVSIQPLSKAQTLEDAVRYSIMNYSSTARSIGVGGSMSAVGADMSTASSNPAGIAEFRKSEFAISFGLPNVETTATIGGTSETESVNRFKLNNAGIVFAYNPLSTKVKTFNLALGVNKLADFNQNVFYGGFSQGTRVERFLELANLRTLGELDNFEAGLAFDTELIVDGNGDTNYESDFVTFNEELYREEFIERTGGMNEIFITIASNYDNKLSYGFTLGIPVINYTESKTYLESDDLFIVNNFFDYIFTQQLNTTGGGINFKAGLIYKVTNKVRLSGAVHSPTWLFLTDEFSTSLDFRLDGEESGLVADSPLSEFEYRLTTPWRALAGIGLIYDLGSLKGFLNGEVEYLNYSSNNFNLTANSTDPVDQFIEEDLNNEINAALTSALNFRLGTELAYTNWRLRVGGALLASPYDNGDILGFDPQYNAGLGYRGNKIYIDLAYSLATFDNQYVPYRLSNPQFEQVINNTTDRSRFSVTIGTKL